MHLLQSSPSLDEVDKFAPKLLQLSLQYLSMQKPSSGLRNPTFKLLRRDNGKQFHLNQAPAQLPHLCQLNFCFEQNPWHASSKSVTTKARTQTAFHIPKSLASISQEPNCNNFTIISNRGRMTASIIRFEFHLKPRMSA